MQEQEAPWPAAVGARVLLGGRAAATVRYVGRLEGQAGTWVGVEYDETGRGKHDGSHAGRRYFACSPGAGPAAGSFVRLQKFLEAADGGRSLADAARERYAGGGNGTGGGDDQQGEQQQQQQYLTTAGSRRVAVEVSAPAPGARRASAAGAALAVLPGERVSSVGPAAALRAVLPELAELDLSGNLVARWELVAELAAAVPTLHTLNLSGNRLALPRLRDPAPAAAAAAALAGLQTLVLNGCGLAWEHAVAVGRQLPALRELHLCSNRLASLALPAAASSGGSGDNAAAALGGLSLDSSGGGGGSCAAGPGGLEEEQAAQLLAAAFPSLEQLDLEGNELGSWADVAALRGLPRLRALLLSGNRLESVEYPGGFACLRSLLLGGNRLAAWAAVDQLDRFPALEEARLSDNPLTAEAPGAARYECIARVSHLTMLNASCVSAAERWDAELAYLRQVTDAAAAAATAGGAAAGGTERAAVLATHPRFAALTQKYGELAPAGPKASAGSALGGSMAAVTISHAGKVVQKKLPVSLTVGKLKLMLDRLLRVKAGAQALLLVPPEGSGAQPEDITDEDARELRYFDLCDGCRLEVTAADPAARAAALAAAKAAAAAAHAARMDLQERSIQQFRAVEQRLMA